MSINADMIERFINILTEEEREKSTAKKYLRDINGFVNWLGEGILDHGNCLKYKDELLNRGLKPSTINGMISALNITPSFMLT